MRCADGALDCGFMGNVRVYGRSKEPATRILLVGVAHDRATEDGQRTQGSPGGGAIADDARRSMVRSKRRESMTTHATSRCDSMLYTFEPSRRHAGN